MKGLIIYKSKYGSTEQYARWLQEETAFEMYDIKDFSKDLADYDIVVLAASIHAGELSLKKFLCTNWSVLSNKTVAVVVTSGAGHREVVNGIIEKSLPPEIFKDLHLFPVVGKYVLKDMSVWDRTLIKIAAFFTKNGDAKAGMLADKNDVNKRHLESAVDFIKGTQIRR